MLTSPNASGAFLQDLGSMPTAYVKQIYALQKQTTDASTMLGDCQFIFTPEVSGQGNSGANAENEEEDLWYNYLLARAKSARYADIEAANSSENDDEKK